jgi:hypothetical protein
MGGFVVNSEYHKTFICCFPNLGASRDSSHSDLAPLGSRAVTLPKPVKAERSRAEPNRGNTTINRTRPYMDKHSELLLGSLGLVFPGILYLYD